MSLLLPIDECDRCKMSIRNDDMLIVGETNGAHKKSWWKLCPKCYQYLYNKYLLKNVNIDKKQEDIVHRDSTDMKIYMEKHAKFWRRF